MTHRRINQAVAHILWSAAGLVVLVFSRFALGPVLDAWDTVEPSGAD